MDTTVDTKTTTATIRLSLADECRFGAEVALSLEEKNRPASLGPLQQLKVPLLMFGPVARALGRRAALSALLCG